MDFTKKFVGYGGRKKYASETPIVKDKGATNVTNIITGGGGSVDLSGYATKAEVATKQDLLVNQRNIKSVNGQSLLGEGNVLIDTSVDLSNYYTKNEVDEAMGMKQTKLISGSNIKTVNGESLLGSGNLVITPIMDDYYTKEESDAKYQPVGEYLTSVPAEYITESELITYFPYFKVENNSIF